VARQNCAAGLKKTSISTLLGLAALVVSGCTASQDIRKPSATGATALQKMPVSSRNVQFAMESFAGREALKFTLSDEEQARQRAGAGPNRPTYLVLADSLAQGSIEVDIAAVVNGKGGAEGRGFAGIAFNIQNDHGTDPTHERFELVYMRASNGLLNVPLPPAPRNVRALQYGAYPDFDFSVSRERFPGQFEKGAKIAAGRWHRLRVDLCGSKITTHVDGEKIMEISSIRSDPRSNRIGLWVGDGTDAYASNFTISPDNC
jgi:hypothetical protein